MWKHFENSKRNVARRDEVTSEEADTASKVYKLLTEAGVSDEVYWSDFTWAKDNDAEEITSYLKRPGRVIINLLGRTSQADIVPRVALISSPHAGDLSARQRVFCESLRQQISQQSGIVCPFAYKGKACCGLRAELNRIYSRLPQEDKAHFEAPDCNIVR